MKKRATIKDLAKETGLSIATISYVLNGKEGVGIETRNVVMKAVKKLGYIPNYAARGLVCNFSKLIGVCNPQTEPGSRLMFENPFYSELLSSIEYECRKHGYHVIISGTDADESYLKLARQRSLDGMIIIGTYSEKFYREIGRTNIPIVLIDTYLESSEFYNVRIDDRMGGYIATKHLLDKGHRNIAFVSGALRKCGVTQLRFDGYNDALTEYGIKLQKKFVFLGIVSFQAGVEHAENVVKQASEVTAIFCTADIIAIGAMKKLSEMGIKVPDDISVMGFDNLDISKYSSTAITTVEQDIHLKGSTAVELILKDISGEISTPQCRILPISIVERQSVKQL